MPCHWRNPDEGWIKVNVDEPLTTKRMKGPWVLWCGTLLERPCLLLGAFVRNARDAEDVEAMAVREGVRLAAECGVGGYPW